MKRRMSRLLLTILLAAILIGTLAGCKNETGRNEANNEEFRIPLEPLGKYPAPVTLTSFFSIATVMLDEFQEEMVKESYFNRRQEEMLNKSIWQLRPGKYRILWW